MKINKRISQSRYQKWQKSESESAKLTVLPKYLYHGTDEASAMIALREGLRPRLKKDGIFERFPSNPNAVYLTNCYGPYFAASASKRKGGRMAIVEVATSTDMIPKLAPDEDYLEQLSRHSSDLPCEYQHWDIFQRTEFFKKHASDRFAVLWPNSLRFFGTVAHFDPICPKCITRIAIIDVETLDWVRSYSGSISIAFDFHKENSVHQKSLTRWIFGESVSRKEVFGDMDLNEAGRKLLSDRSGIEIISNTCDLPYAA